MDPEQANEPFWNQDDASQTTDDQLKMTEMTMLFLHVTPPLHSLYKWSHPLLVERVGESAFGQMSATLPSSCWHLK